MSALLKNNPTPPPKKKQPQSPTPPLPLQFSLLKFELQLDEIEKLQPVLSGRSE